LVAIGLERGDMLRYRTARNQTADLGAMLAFWQSQTAPSILKRWKTSSAEWNASVFVASRLDAEYDIARAKRDLVDGARRDLVLALLATNDDRSAVADVADWTVPVFPLKGRDLIAAGMAPGKAMGETLASLRNAWLASDYLLSATE
ncbi:hypothetical protein GQM99_25090, partial [Escherichia coli]|uniref:hypothetical protein n=1 Tax=Escherichia coli TaxID=562 RepID=UPI0013C63D5C